jgi:uncharacterized protein with von Willebrand factor type A (vWA) domain
MDILREAISLTSQSALKTDKRILHAIDVSGSMEEAINKTLVSAWLSLKSTPNASMLYFSNVLDKSIPPLRRSMSFDEVTKIAAEACGGGTDLTLPFKYVISQKAEHNIKYDMVCIWTDNEDWFSKRNVYEYVDEIRRKNKDFKVVQIQMTPDSTSMLSKKDSHFLDIVGFDPSLPDIIAMFADMQIGDFDADVQYDDEER